METIANKCNIIKNVENSQTNSEINASVVGENILKAAFPQITGFIIEDYTISPLEVRLVLRSTASHAFCDRCGRLTFHTRGWQKRTVTMRPLVNKRFVLVLYMRRFFCKAEKHIFVEQQYSWLNKYARYSICCIELMNRLHLRMSSVSTSSILRKMGITCCPNTCINHLIKTRRSPARTAVNIGIDDFAKRKGHSYGSVIVDHDTNKILELIDSRDSKAVAKVLRQYHDVKSITRDRGNCFINAIRQGAPSATVITDKFHVVENLTGAVFPQLQRWFLQVRKKLLSKGMIGPKSPQIDKSWLYSNIYSVMDVMCKDVRRNRKMEDWRLFMHLYARQELSLKEIHEKTGFSGAKMGKLRDTSYESLLNGEQRWVYDNMEAVTRRILCKKSLDYTVIVKGLHSTSKKGCLKKLLFLLRGRLQKKMAEYKNEYNEFLQKNTIKKEESDLWNSIVHFNYHPKTLSVKMFLSDSRVGNLSYYMSTFQGIMSGESKMNLYQWINMAIGCGEEEIEKFAKGLTKDYQAIKNSIDSKWNNGVLEGSVCKIKTVKRIMGGRASIPLLELKVSSNLNT